MLCRLKDALNTTVDRLGYRGRLRSLAAMQAWNEDIAPCLATKSRATFIRGKVLYVTVEKPVWAQQLSMMKQDLIDRVNASALSLTYGSARARSGRHLHGVRALARRPRRALAKGLPLLFPTGHAWNRISIHGPGLGRPR